MNYRKLGKTEFQVSEVSLGTWQVGGRWGDSFDEKNANRIIHAALDGGVNFIDTADVYSEGLSEVAVGKAIKERSERIYVATKCGRQINPHVSKGYQVAALRNYVESSLRNMDLEALDLIQLHCPPAEVYDRPDIFELFDRLKEEGKILNLGVSVEKIEEAQKAIKYSNVTTIQIIFNMFRQRPAELFFKEAAKRNVGIIVRVPLASGLLTGKYSINTTFGPDDHRTFNRNGEAFDKGETFSGIDYETGLQAVAELKTLFRNMDNLAPVALKWVLTHPEVSCVIPGASKLAQVHSNLEAMELSELTAEQLQEINRIYDTYIRAQVHQYW